MNQVNNISYLEIPVQDIEASKTFFGKVFGWSFIDYGPDYSSFTQQGMDGGFYTSDLTVATATGSPLIVLYSDRLEDTQENIKDNGGKIIKPVFSFPGGRRFHFTDHPSGNEFAVWTDN